MKHTEVFWKPWQAADYLRDAYGRKTAADMGLLSPTSRPEPPLEQHPLVVHYGLPFEHLALARAHRAVEGSHRTAAWRVVLDFVEPSVRPRVVDALAGVGHPSNAAREGHRPVRPALADILTHMFGGRSIQLVRVFGIRIGVDPSWFLVLFLVALLL